MLVSIHLSRSPSAALSLAEVSRRPAEALDERIGGSCQRDLSSYGKASPGATLTVPEVFSTAEATLRERWASWG